MSRPRRDGSPSRATVKRRLTDPYVNSVKPSDRRVIIYDEKQRGLCLIVQAKPSSTKSFACLYYKRGPRWLSLGRTNEIGLSDARKLAAEIALQVAVGKDPAAEKRAARSQGTFAELARRYVEEEAKVENRSWQATDRLVRTNLLPRWGKLAASEITMADVEAALERIGSKATSNLVLAGASAIFRFGIKKHAVKVNPCYGISSHKFEARQRVLSDSEIPKIWREFDGLGIKGTALKVALLTGQRIGEIIGLRREHVEGNLWTLPGKVIPELRWNGTKNKRDHRVWLSEPVLELLSPLPGDQPFGKCSKLAGVMQDICAKLGVERATPHDLRRSFSTKVTGLGFGRSAMNRLTNHKEGGIGDVYDAYGYAEENRKIMETVAKHIMSLVEGPQASNVVPMKR